MPRKKRYTKKYMLSLIPEDFDKLWLQFEKSTFKRFSEFLRALIFNQPVKIRYRNETAEDFLKTAVEIKNSLTELISRADGNPAASPDIAILRAMLEEIRHSMHKMYQLWLVESPSAPAEFSSTTRKK